MKSVAFTPRKLTFLGLILGLFFMSFTELATTWELAKEGDGVKVYTRHIDGWDIKEYRAQAKMHAPFEKVVNAYRSGKARSQWMSKRATGVKNLKEVTKDKVYTYTHADAPWPVSDRDNVTLVEYSYPRAGVVHAKLTAAPDFIPRKDGVIRIERMKAHWEFEDLGNGYVLVTTQAVADLRGSLPNWLVNANIVSGPHESLSGLKKYVEG